MQTLRAQIAAMPDGHEISGEFEYGGDMICYSISRYAPDWELCVQCCAYPFPGSPPEVYHEGGEYFDSPAGVMGALSALGYAEPATIDDCTPDMFAPGEVNPPPVAYVRRDIAEAFGLVGMPNVVIHN